MSFNTVEKAKGFITNPVKSFQQSREDKLDDAIKYFTVILTIFAALWGIITMVNTGVGDGIEYFIGGFIEFFIGAFIGGAALQLSLIIIGSEKEGFGLALKVIIYGSTPCMLFGWIPVLGIIAGFWSLVLLILGVRELYRISTARTLTVILLMLINAFFLIVFVLSVFIMIFEDVSVPWFIGGNIFFAAVLALFDGGMYLFCKSWNEPSATQQSASPSVPVSSPSPQKHSKEDDLFFDRISRVSLQMTNTLKEIETGLQKMKAAHPAWMGRPEFAPLVLSIEENQADPSKYDETERVYEQLKGQVEFLEQSIRDLDRLRR